MGDPGLLTLLFPPPTQALGPRAFPLPSSALGRPELRLIVGLPFTEQPVGSGGLAAAGLPGPSRLTLGRQLQHGVGGAAAHHLLHDDGQAEDVAGQSPPALQGWVPKQLWGCPQLI